MKKLLLILSISCILTACGGGDGNNDNTVVVSGVGTTTNINKGGKYNLTISGTNNIVTIRENNSIQDLDVSGTENTVYIEENTTIDVFTVSGVNNTIFVPVDSQISFSDTGVGNQLKTRTTNSIIGIWSFTYPATQCVETYTFNSDGTFSETSLDEVAGGTYVFEETVITGTRHLLSLSFTTDNGLSDCNGLSEDDSGLNVTVYQNYQSATVIEWFAALEGGSAIIVLTKQ